MPQARKISDADIQLAKELLRYDAGSGVFAWAVTRGRSAKAGQIAGAVSNTGYLQIKVGQRYFKAHRLAWALHFGPLDGGEIDHINGDRTDNRIENLRLVDRIGNAGNITKANTRSKTGLLGVRVDMRRGKFSAGITRNGRFQHLGMHDSAEQAHEAYLVARSAEDIAAPGRIAARRLQQACRNRVVCSNPTIQGSR